jgi:7-carboxy-7-deazaguanine synthase
MYRVKEIFGPTLQGEGMHAGMPCLFVRLAGCNAWDGRAETRATSACPYCDTDFRGGETLTLAQITDRLAALALTSASAPPLPRSSAPVSSSASAPAFGCVLSGGEPMLQADAAVLAALGERFAWVDIETNGTRPCPPRPANVFISCSPKHLAEQPIVIAPDWWKVLIPDQERFLDRCLASGAPVFVQPTCPDGGPHGATYDANLRRCVALCLERGCRLSLQLHKYLRLP